MEASEYQKKAMSTCLPESDNLVYMMLGLVEEIGEFAGKIAKMVRKGKVKVTDNKFVFTSECTLDERQELLSGLKKEGGDIAWMHAGLMRQFGWDLSEVMEGNIDKLADRKERGKIDGAGDDR